MIRNDDSKRFPPVELVEPEISIYSKYDFETSYEISLVIPTRNESGNIEPLLMRLHQALKGISTEVVFVDDSTDDTPDVIRKLQEWFPLKVKLIARPPERRKNGLGGAVVEGFQQARGTWVCVMDADLQHPPEVIPQLLDQAQKTGSDLVMGSRLAPGGDASNLGFKRMFISQTFAWVTRFSFPQRLRKVTDPLTGFFMTRRAALKAEELTPDGFKILLEILVSHPELKVSEVPIHFGQRNAGESKASVKETIKFFRGLFRLRLAGQANFIKFLTVGLSGLVVNSLALAAFTELAGVPPLLSAGIATQVSTLWNFAGTEWWVFGKREAGRSFWQRLVGFLLMNNGMLLLRVPVMALLVQVGIHYVIANLVSLFAMTIVRYLVADKWIWNKTNNNKEKRKTDMNLLKGNTTAQAKQFGYNYNIHDILKVTSMYELPELEYFRVPALTGDPDIRVRLERRRKQDRRQARPVSMQPDISEQRRSEKQRRYEELIRYGESLGRFGFEISIAHKNCIEVAVSPIITLSPHVLYTNVVEPILRWSFVRKGYALAHAACIAVDGRAVLVTARTDTGKTSTILRTVDNYACSFLSDDMTIVSKDGTVLSFPKPLTISNHTLSAVNANSSLTWWERIALQFQSRLHSKSGRKVGLNLSQSKLPAATMNAVVQMLVPPPKYMVHRLIPKVTYANQAQLSGAVIIERGPEFEEELQHAQAVETFVNNAEDAYGFPPYPILADSLSRWEEEDLHPYEEAIVAEALRNVRTIRLRDPQFNWWQKLPLVAQNSSGVVAMQFAATDD